MNWIENTSKNELKIIEKNNWKCAQADKFSLNKTHEDVINFIFLLKRDFLSHHPIHGYQV